ncbi:MAG: hypothetical protein AB1491_10925 [Thermodesulfobacteriota bacterium]
MLQLIETRLLSVILWYHLAFFAISMAMFGLTAGAVWVYLKGERYSGKTLSYDLGYMTGAFALTTLLSLVLQMSLTLTITFSLTGIIVWVLLAGCMAVPYFFSGVTISLALTRSPYPIGRVYGVDLLGAAVGCLGVLLLLNSTDGPSAVIWVGALAGAGAIFFAGSGIGGQPEKLPPFASFLKFRWSIFLGLVLLAAANGLTPYGLQPLIVKDKIERRSPSLVEEWNSFSRVTVLTDSWKGAPQIWGPSPRLPAGLLVDKKYMEIDGFASTTMYRFHGNIEEAGFLKYDVTNLAYFLPQRRRAAIIGVGGGRDVLSAWVFGLRDITGVEINPVFIRLLTQDTRFAPYAGLHGLDQVRLVVDEARSWFARTREKFDIIQMTLTDTEAATGAGAFTLSENGLYTVEALKIFLARLTPTGVFTVSRWYAPGQVNETGRIISLAAATLLDLGVTEPQRHIFVAAAQNIATMLVARSPFSPEDLKALNQAAAHLKYQVLLRPAAPPRSKVLQSIFKARNGRELAQYTAGFELDLKPPTDDRPFFFNQLPFYKPLTVFNLAVIKNPSGVMYGNLLAALTLLLILLVSVVMVLLTIVIPLRPALRGMSKRLVLGGTTYFFLIGIGFMTVEIGLLQRMSVFLGHPIYSLSVVLFSLILTTGVGSLISDRWPLNRAVKLILWSGLTGAYILTLSSWMPSVLLAWDQADLVRRCALCVAIIAPAGLLMGFGFPTGMRLVAARNPKPTPWFWGINGAAGVLAASVTVGLSIAFGISAALMLGGACYLCLIPAALTIGFTESANTTT